MLDTMNDLNESPIAEFRCCECLRRYYGPPDGGLIGVRYLGGLYAYQSSALGCPRCGAAIEEAKHNSQVRTRALR